MCSVAPSSRWQMTWSLLTIVTPATSVMSAAVTTAGPVALSVSRLLPSLSMATARPLRFRTMSVTSSRTPATDENSCSTPSICTAVTAAPCSDDSNTRRSALPSVRPKPRSSGSATAVTLRRGLPPGTISSAVGLMSSCQFLWIMLCPPCSRPGRSIARAAPEEMRAPPLPFAGGRRRSEVLSVQTRRRFGGRQPLCAIGVTSLIAVI